MTEATFHVGERIANRYRILSQLGSGGSGVVFDARDEFTSRRVALKLPHDRTSVPGTVRARLLREAEVGARVRHDNAAHVLCLGEDGGVPFLVMERLLGRNLRSLLRGAPFPWPRTASIVSQIASALAAAHDRGVVHADVKPENIFLTREQGRVLLIDFGLARLSAGTGDAATDRMVSGTPLYMSPEQARGLPLGPGTDVYSLGCVLHELASGAPPFSGTPAELMHKHVHEAPPRPQGVLPPGYLPEVAVLLRDMLSKAPQARPTAAAVFAALRGSFGDP